MIKATVILVIGLYSYGVSGSLVNVRLPFLNPAGVTYINGPTPTGLVAGPVAIPQRYAQPHFAAPVQYNAPVQFTGPGQYAAPTAYAAHNVFAAPAFAAPLLKAAPVQHVPAVADIPVTHYEAHHGFVQKLVDVAKPALKTRKFEVRRPAIQKQFYDIEERIIVRPAGSALVELDQPTSKNQKGADIITPVLPAMAVSAVPVPAVPISARIAVQHPNVFVSSTPSPFVYSTDSQLQFAPQLQQEQQPHPQQQQPQQEQPPQNNFNPANNEDNNESVVVEARSNFGQINPQQPQRQEQAQSTPQLETEVRFRSFGSQPPAPRFNLAQSNEEQQQQQFPQQQQQYQENLRSNEQRNYNSPQFLPQREQNQQQNEPQLRNAPQFFQPEQNNEQNQQQQTEPEQEQQQQRSEPQSRQIQQANFEQQQQEQNQVGPSQNIIFRNAITEEESQNNQQRLIRLLTENDGVSELDQFEGRKFSFRGDSGLLRARVLQFNQAGPNAKATDERVNTRRVVLSRPIETVQEIEVVEPITKIHKVAFNEPTIFKSARLGYQRVHTSVPAFPLHAQYSDFHH